MICNATCQVSRHALIVTQTRILIQTIVVQEAAVGNQVLSLRQATLRQKWKVQTYDRAFHTATFLRTIMVTVSAMCSKPIMATGPF